jgi:hypothetical protein
MADRFDFISGHILRQLYSLCCVEPMIKERSES